MFSELIMSVLSGHNDLCIIHLQYYKSHVMICLFCRFPQFWSTNCLPRYFLWSMCNCLTGRFFFGCTIILSCYKYEICPCSVSSLFENRLLLRRECCSFSNGQYIKDGLTQLKYWCNDISQEVVHLSTILL